LKLVACTLRVQSNLIIIEGRFVPKKPEYVNDVYIQAGEFVGLGDARTIGLGRFKVLAFEEPDSS
jgi:hypothetical protein